VSQVQHVQAAYEEMRAAGQTHTIAEILATRRAPASRTDREFLLGHCNGSQFQDQPKLGDHYKNVAEANGQDTTGKVYLSQLANFPGDPEAWVSGRGDVERVCRERGWGCEGHVNVPHRGVTQGPQPTTMAPDLIEAHGQTMVAENPDLAKLPKP